MHFLISSPISTSYNYIIAGAGCAGLSLAWYMSQQGLAGKKILIADKSLRPNNDKTWCFWKKGDLPFSGLIDYEWNYLEFRTAHFQKTSELSPFGYYCVRSDTYHEKLTAILRENPQIDWLESDIGEIRSDGNHARMNSQDGEFEAEYIFQSISAFDIDSHELNLRQHFTGWEIETGKPLFKPDTACFMDLSVAQHSGLAFMYILPFSSTRAILEYTLFSDKLLSTEDYEYGIRSYLSERLNLQDGDYNIIRMEKGIIPMVDNGFAPGDGGRVINIGAAAGLAKASTGYTFSRTQTASRQITEKLVKGEYPSAENPSSPRFRAYDILLLHIIKHQPDRAYAIFEALFRKNSLGTILKFLSEDTTLTEELKIFWSLPNYDFLKAIFNTRSLLVKNAKT